MVHKGQKTNRQTIAEIVESLIYRLTTTYILVTEDGRRKLQKCYKSQKMRAESYRQKHVKKRIFRLTPPPPSAIIRLVRHPEPERNISEMQVATSEQVRFLGCDLRQKDDKTFYFVNLCDETGESFKLFADEQCYLVAKGCSFGENVIAVFEVQNGRDNLRINLRRLERI